MICSEQSLTSIHASILSIGDELVLGQIVDTNSAWLSRRLADAGVSVSAHLKVGDDQRDTADGIRSLAALQGDWESKEPERGHRVKASEWKAKLRATPTP